MNKYIILYIKRNIVLIFGIAFFIILLFTIVGLLAKSDLFDIVMAICLPLFFAFSSFLISLLPIIRFKKMISYQKSNYNFSFNNDNEIAIDKPILKYLTDKWFICSGTFAFHYQYINKISYKTVHREFGTSYKVLITTIDNKKYSIWFRNTTAIKKVESWLFNLIKAEKSF